MKRVKTKQEMRLAFNKDYKCNYGLPLNKVRIDQVSFISGCDITTDPHPFDSMDIKVRVTPKQSKKLQKKAFKMGYGWSGEGEGVYWDLGCALHHSILLRKEKSMENGKSTCEGHTELTYKQFMNGTVPEKKVDHPIKADDIIKPEVMERLKEVTILSIKACKSIKEVEEAYTSLQNTIKEL